MCRKESASGGDWHLKRQSQSTSLDGSLIVKAKLDNGMNDEAAEMLGRINDSHEIESFQNEL
jgi:hypothetical protein